MKFRCCWLCRSCGEQHQGGAIADCVAACSRLCAYVCGLCAEQRRTSRSSVREPSGMPPSKVLSRSAHPDEMSVWPCRPGLVPTSAGRE